MGVRGMDALELIDLIASEDGSGEAVLERVVPELGRLIRAEVAIAYRAVPRGGPRDVPAANGWALEFGFVDGDGAGSLCDDFDRYLARAPRRFGLYDPMRPEPAQRNRVVQCDLRASEVPLHRDLLAPLGYGRHHQARVLLCDGPVLLGWVGGFRRGAWTERELEALRAIAGPLRIRLALERQVARGASYRRGLAASLEAIDGPAFLVRGGIVAANGAGRALLDRDGGVRERVTQAARDPSPRGARVARLRAPGVPAYTLVALTAPRADGDARAAAFSGAHGMTPRQTDVLRHLARGDTNRVIAEKIGCAEATVELHVTAILRKSGAATRSALIARFWTE